MIYDEVKLCITAQLFTTIRKSCWLSDQPTVAVSMGSKGLSPFAVPELSEDLVDNMNEQVKSFQAVTTKPAKRLCNVMTIKMVVEQNISGFILHLK
eukprot:7101834-Ditylum_brightwellii.AAC.1